MPIGDINSTERGSGARYNDGKAPLHLVPAVFYAQAADRIDAYKRLADGCRHIHQLQVWDGDGQIVGVFDYTARELALAADVFEYGIGKYAPWNWAKGMPWSVPVGCALRHAEKMLIAGPNSVCNDADSKLPHWGHFLCNLIMLDWYRVHYPEGNDIRIFHHE